MSFNKRYYSTSHLVSNAKSMELESFIRYMLNPDAYIFSDQISSNIHDLFGSEEESRECVWMILASQENEDEPSLVLKSLSKVWATVSNKNNTVVHKDALIKFNELFKEVDESCAECLKKISNIMEKKINKINCNG